MRKNPLLFDLNSSNWGIVDILTPGQQEGSQNKPHKAEKNKN